MEKLKTNELSLGLNQTFRNDLVDNFKKIQNGVDGQSDTLNKQITDLLGDVTPQDQNEVTQARIDVHGKPYGTLKSRADATQATAENALSEERDTSAEVQDARTNSSSKTYPTLKARMDSQENDLNNSINNKLSKISSVPEAFANLAAIKSKYPNGKTGLFVTADNGHKYIWANSTWTDAGVYQAAGVGDKTITPSKTTFIHEEKTLNLFDRYTVKENVFITGDTGSEVANNNYCASDYIPVNGGTLYSANLSSELGKAFYDENKTFIIGDTLEAPANAHFLRVTTPNPVPLDIMVIEGSKIPHYYIPYILTSMDREVKILKESLPDGKYVEKENTEFIAKDNTINLFNRNTVKKGVFIVGNNGYEEARAGYAASDYIPVNGGELYSANLSSGLGKAFYDENKTFIIGDTLEAPANAHFLRVTTPDPIPDDVMVVEGEFLPENYIPYGVQYTLEGINVITEKRRWENEIISILGDSITAGFQTTRTYWQYANEKMKAKILINAISSTEISTGGTYPNPFISRYMKIDSRSKLIVVFGGVNDSEHNVELGTFDSRDNATFYGALHNLCNGLYTNYPDAQYAFFTPLQQAYLTPNKKGYVLTDYVDAIIKVCGFYGIPVLDLNRKSGIYPMNAKNKAKYMSDGTHPNALGHKRIAPTAASFLESL
ncbi:SGNH/GDSL hydrolase family protein [Lactobacillus plantarum]|uniref:SGNH/GDSL hydrolase family protein n=1 Tax=Lactiplantibacillus plantarum TaxID=1590 RepID=UPI0015EBB5CE|nr:SGNH/GDSL hydrolase family protein [Lactiplantibacillus plantarum]MBA3081156.1 SGNH/GDSL hydrolase family protein [Lactiplantibacillus plantarum]